MNPHEFQLVAKQFRAGKISLAELTSQVFPEKAAVADDVPALLQRLCDRPPDSHKGDYGHVLVIAGSPGMAGAAALTGMAALRSGAGLVTVATDSRCQETVASFHPALMTVGLPTSEASFQWSDWNSRFTSCNCIAIGPGLGQSDRARQLVRDVVNGASVPVVIDADGLNCLGLDFEFQPGEADRVLTPHPGELKRLVSASSSERQELESLATALADSSQSIVVLKGHRSLVTDGQRAVHNASGNPGMATAGSGDVLTGVIAALLGQGFTGWESAVAGCYLHGKAGDIAAKRKSAVSMVATDIIDCLPNFLASL